MGRSTKRAASIQMGRLIEQYGARLALECCGDYCRQHLALNVWAPRFDAAAEELRKESEGRGRARRARLLARVKVSAAGAH